MKDFNYYAPTQVAFGRKAEQATGRLVKQYGGTKVLVHYGGKSAERSGLLDAVCHALEAEHLPYVKLGGVVPNPRLSKVHEGIDLCRAEGVDSCRRRRQRNRFRQSHLHGGNLRRRRLGFLHP